MRLKNRISLGIISAMLLPISVFANSAPLIMEEDPTFSIAPMGSTPISVISEYLEFDMKEGQGSTAKVTASYEMENTSKASIEQSMMFPFITSHRKGFLSNVKITANDKPMAFKVFRLKDIPYMNYQGSTNDYFDRELPSVVAIDTIVEMLNFSEYTPKHYHPDETINVYTLHLKPKEEAYQEEVSYKIDPQKHKLLSYNYNGLRFNEDGSGTLSTRVAPKELQADGHKIYIVVLGEDSENGASFEFPAEQEITVKEKTFEAFLKEDIIKSRLTEDRLEDEKELYTYAIKQLDTILSRNQPFIALDEDVLSPFFYNAYVGALLYQVEFPPAGRMNVTVEYEMEATKDRRQTKDYTDMFSYLLRPAAGWKDFGHLTIKVIPNESKPFVTESSLPLIEDEITGSYYGEFEGLPEKDLYFITYKTDQSDPPLPKLISNLPYLLFFLSPIILAIIIVGGIVAILVTIKKKRSC